MSLRCSCSEFMLHRAVYSVFLLWAVSAFRGKRIADSVASAAQGR